LVAEVSSIKVSVEIYCSAPTKAIAKLILLDSAKIQEEEAEKLIKANIPNMKLRHFMMWNKPKKCFFQDVVK
jgi:Cft2 family RNA processing exonuclease